MSHILCVHIREQGVVVGAVIERDSKMHTWDLYVYIIHCAFCVSVYVDVYVCVHLHMQASGCYILLEREREERRVHYGMYIVYYI